MLCPAVLTPPRRTRPTEEEQEPQEMQAARMRLRAPCSKARSQPHLRSTTSACPTATSVPQHQAQTALTGMRQQRTSEQHPEGKHAKMVSQPDARTTSPSNSQHGGRAWMTSHADELSPDRPRSGDPRVRKEEEFDLRDAICFRREVKLPNRTLLSSSPHLTSSHLRLLLPTP